MPPSFRGSNMNGPSLTGLPDAEAGVIVRNGSNLNGSNLNGVHIRNGSNLNGSNLNGVNIQGIHLTNGHHLSNGTALAGVQIDGARIVDADGRPVELPVGALLPALLADGTTIDLRIDGIRHDDGLVYYALSFEGVSLCGEGTDGLFVEGIWDSTGARSENPEFPATYSCTTGVVAKCASWGYEPSVVGADVHQACTRMARADYCGDGIPHTVEGTEIDVFDDLGVYEQLPDAEFEFEAAWGPDGAVCVSRPRYDERVVGIGEVLPECWDALPRCESLQEAKDEAQIDGGPHLANGSVPQPLLLCQPR